MTDMLDPIFSLHQVEVKPWDNVVIGQREYGSNRYSRRLLANGVQTAGRDRCG